MSKRIPTPTTLHSMEDGRIFRLLVESVRDYAIFMLDPAGRVVSWNLGARAIKGYSADEIVGQHFSRFYPQEQVERGWPDYELTRAAADGHFEDESWRVRKDGSRFWANVVITALRDENGELLGFSKVTRDLTERRQQEEALRQSEERFRTLVEHVSDYAIFMLNPEGFVTTWNTGARQITGYEPDEIIGSHLSRFYPPEAIRSAWPEHELRVARMEGRFEDEGWRIRKDGSRFWANVVITALRDPTGELVGFSKITRDLTERRRQEQALSQSEERFRLLVEGVDDYAIFMLDRNGFVSSWNAGAERINGYSSKEILGKHFSHFYPSEDVAAHKPWKQISEARDVGRVSDEGWRARKDGTLFWASSVMTALHDADGRPYGFANVMQDLTQRRHAEALADRAQRMHEFIAMLAHELRNPLAPIRNAVELMGRKGLGDPVLEAMRQTIDRQSTLLTRIIDEFLDVNRIARGKFAISKEPVDLSAVLSRAIETTRPLIDAQGQRLEVDAPPKPLWLKGDSLRLTQVLVNLLNNAAKFTQSGGRIWLKVERRGTDAEIRVRDNGRGIDPDHLESIFDLFTQISPESVRGQGGLGVGLALVRRVVELHGGMVQAKSDGIGRGTEFIVRLPLGLDQVQGVPSAEPSAEGDSKRLRVLVVDDNKDAADSLHLLLEAIGQDVFTVYDGMAALDIMEKFRPDVVMLDIGMPQMSGYDVASEIHERIAPGRRPILAAVTGWGQETDRDRSREAGFEYHFVKPVEVSVLRELIGDIAEKRAGRR
jgi:PAS domain S-box-containing protein